jgi:diacylglycerol kinase (ATP)
MANNVAGLLKAAGISVTVRHTSAAGDARRLAAEFAAEFDDQGAAGASCLVACGGDGTVQEAAQALAECHGAPADRPALALAPAGRCNDFARALGIPRDPRGIAEVLLHGRVRNIDLGRVNDRVFCTVAAVGADAVISDYVDRMKVPLRGTPAYLFGALRVLSRYRGCRVCLEGDFGTIDQTVFVASCANTSSYGGAIRIAPTADPTDGRLDLCIIHPVSTPRIATLLPRVLLGRHLDQPEVRLISTCGFTIRSTEPLTLWADGEPIAQTPARIEAMAGVLKMRVPQGNAP